MALVVPLGVGAMPAGGTSPDDAVVLYDLSDPDAPRRASRVVLPGSGWSWGLRAEAGLVWITHHRWEPADPEGRVRYYLDRIDVADPAAPVLLPPVNVPGVFLGAAAAGTRVHTLETTWDAAGQVATTWLHALDLTARGTARPCLSRKCPTSGCRSSMRSRSGGTRTTITCSR